MPDAVPIAAGITIGGTLRWMWDDTSGIEEQQPRFARILGEPIE